MKKIVAAVLAIGALISLTGKDIKRYIDMKRM